MAIVGSDKTIPSIARTYLLLPIAVNAAAHPKITNKKIKTNGVAALCVAKEMCPAYPRTTLVKIPQINASQPGLLSCLFSELVIFIN